MARNYNLDKRTQAVETELSLCAHDEIVHIDDVHRLAGYSWLFIPPYNSRAGCLHCGDIINAASPDYRRFGSVYRRIPNTEKEMFLWGV